MAAFGLTLEDVSLVLETGNVSLLYRLFQSVGYDMNIDGSEVAFAVRC